MSSRPNLETKTSDSERFDQIVKSLAGSRRNACKSHKSPRSFVSSGRPMNPHVPKINFKTTWSPVTSRRQIDGYWFLFISRYQVSTSKFSLWTKMRSAFKAKKNHLKLFLHIKLSQNEFRYPCTKERSGEEKPFGFLLRSQLTAL